MSIMPARVWLRKCGGGLTLPGGKPYLTVTGDDRELPRHVEYVRADAFDDMKAALTDALRSTRKDFKAGPDGDRQHREAYAEQFAALSKAEGHIGQELAPDPERRVNGNANGDEG